MGQAASQVIDWEAYTQLAQVGSDEFGHLASVSISHVLIYILTPNLSNNA